MKLFFLFKFLIKFTKNIKHIFLIVLFSILFIFGSNLSNANAFINVPMVFSQKFNLPKSSRTWENNNFQNKNNESGFNQQQLANDNTKLLNDDSDVDEGSMKYHESGIITKGSLKNLGVIKRISMDRLHAYSTNTRISELHFVDVFGNQIPWKLNSNSTSVPIPNYNKTSYINSVNNKEVKKQKILKFLETSLQDNAYSPNINSASLKSENDNWWKKFADNSYIDKIINNYKHSTSVGFQHDNKFNKDDKNTDLTLGGIDLAFVLSVPAIIDRIEIWMAPNNNNEEKYIDYRNSSVKIKSIDLESSTSLLGDSSFFGIDSLSVQTFNNKWFYTSVRNDKFVNDKNTPSSISEFNNSKPFALSKELHTKEIVEGKEEVVKNNARLWDLKQRINSHNYTYGARSLASDIRNALFVGGKYDFYERVWLEKFSTNKKVTTGEISIKTDFTLGNKVRSVISIDAPHGYVTLFTRGNKNIDRTGSLITLPNILGVNQNVNYGWIEAIPDQEIRYFYVRANYANQHLNMINYPESISKFLKSKNQYDYQSNSNLIITPKNNVLTVSSNKNLEDKSIHFSWDRANLINKFISSYKINNLYLSRMFWKKLNIPKTDSNKYIFNIYYRIKSPSKNNTNLWSNWKKYEVINDYSEIFNSKIGSDIQVSLLLKDEYILNDIVLNNDYFTKTVILKNIRNFNFPISNLINDLNIKDDSIQTSKNLTSLGFIEQINLELFSPESSLFTGLRILDVNNNALNYSINFIEMINEKGEHEILSNDLTSKISQLLKSKNSSIYSYVSSGLFNKTSLKSNKFEISKTKMEFAKFSKNHKLKFSISLPSASKINFIEFFGGQTKKGKRILINKISIKNSEKNIYEKIYKNPLDSYINNFTNFNGFPLLISSDEKKSIYNGINIYDGSYDTYFGKQNKIYWKQNNDNQKIISSLKNLGKFKQVLVSIYGSSIPSENAIKNIIFLDENGKPILYDVIKTYFASGFDNNTSGDLVKQDDQNVINKLALPKRSIFSINDDTFKSTKHIYSGASNSYINRIWNHKWYTGGYTIDEFNLIQNILRDETNPFTIESTIERVKINYGKPILGSSINDLSQIANYEQFTNAGKFTATLDKNTKDGDLIKTFILKDNAMQDIEIKILWSQNKKNKNIFNIIVKIKHTNGNGENDLIFSITPKKYDIDQWMKIYKKTREMGIKESWVFDPFYDTNFKYKKEYLSKYLQDSSINDIGTFKNKIYYFTRDVSPSETWKSLYLGEFNNSGAGYSDVKVVNARSEMTYEERVIKNISLENNDKKIVSFSIDQLSWSEAGIFNKSGIKKIQDRLSKGFITNKIYWNVNSVSKLGDFSAILDNSVKDGDVISEYKISENELTINFIWQKNVNNKWSIIMKVVGKVHDNAEENDDRDPILLINNVKIDGTPLIIYPFASLEKTSYDNKIFKNDGLKELDFYSQFPIMKIHVKFKDGKEHTISGIKFLSIGNDELQDVQKNYFGIGSRRIDLDLISADNKIYSSNKIYSTKIDSTNFTPEEWEHLRNNDKGWVTTYYGLKELEWTKEEIELGSKFYLKYNEFQDPWTEFKLEYSVDGGKTWVSDYKVDGKVNLIIRISKLNNKPDAKYSILGFNYAGEIEVKTVVKNISNIIKNQIPNLNKNINDMNINFNKDLNEKLDGNNSLWLHFLSVRNSLEFDLKLTTFEDLINWLNGLDDPQLFKYENVINFLLHLNLSTGKFLQGTGAIGDGSNKIYASKIENFSDGNKYKYIKLDLTNISNKKILFNLPPFSNKADIKISGIDSKGYIEYLNYIKNSNYENIKITLNKGKSFEKVFFNENAIGISNGDTIEIIITPKNANFMLEIIDENKNIVKVNQSEFKISFEVMNLPQEKEIDFNSSTLSSNLKNNVTFSGSEGSMTINGMYGFLPTDTSWYIQINKNQSNSKIKYISQLTNLNIINGDEVSIGLIANDGYIFKNGLHTINKLFSKNVQKLQKKNRVDIPEIKSSNGAILENNFVYTLISDNTLQISSNDPLFISLKNGIDLNKFIVHIYVYGFGETTPRNTFNVWEDLVNADLKLGDKITINIVPRNGIFSNGNPNYELSYIAKINSNTKKQQGKGLPYSAKLISEIPKVIGFDGGARLSLANNYEIKNLLKNGYKVTIYVFRKQMGSSLDHQKINSYIDDLSERSKNGNLFKKKTNYDTWPRPFLKKIEYDINSMNNQYSELDFNFKNDDKIIVLVNPDYSNNYYWDDNNISIDAYKPFYFEVKNLRQVAAYELPKMNTNFIGYNGNNELREKVEEKIVYTNGLLFPNLSNYMLENKNVNVSAYILRQENSAVQMSFNNNSVDNKRPGYFPIIIQGIKQISNYNNNNIKTMWGKVDLSMKFPALYNGDKLLIIYESTDPTKTFSNGMSKIINTFDFKTELVAIPTPVLPNQKSSSLFYGINGKGIFDFNATKVDFEKNDIKISWIYKQNNKINERNFYSYDAAEKAINGHIKNGDKITIVVNPKKNFWWGLNIANKNYSEFVLNKVYVAKNIPDKLLPLEPWIKPVIYPNKFITGTESDVSVKIEELFKLNIFDSYPKYEKYLIIKNKNGNNVLYKKITKDTKNINLSNLVKEGFKALVLFKPSAGYTFNNTTESIESNKYLIKYLTKSVFSYINLDNKSKIYWMGFLDKMWYKFYNLKPEYGKFKLVYKLKDDPNDTIHDVPGGFDNFRSKFSEWNFYIKFTPNHDKDYWINSSKKNVNPNDDFKLYQTYPNKAKTYDLVNNTNDIYNNLKSLISGNNVAINGKIYQGVNGHSFKLFGKKGNLNVKIADSIVNFIKDMKINISFIYDTFSKVGNSAHVSIDISTNIKEKKNMSELTDGWYIEINDENISYFPNWGISLSPRSGQASHKYLNAKRYTRYFYQSIYPPTIKKEMNHLLGKKIDENWDESKFIYTLDLSGDKTINYPITKLNIDKDSKVFIFELDSTTFISNDIFNNLFKIALYKKSGNKYVDITYSHDLMGNKIKNYSIELTRSNGKWIMKFSILPKVSSNLNDIYKVEFKINNNIKFDNNFNHHYALKFNGISIDQFMIDNIKFNKNMRHVIEYPTKVKEVVFDRNNKIPGKAIIDFKAMGVDINSPYYQTIVTWINNKGESIRTSNIGSIDSIDVGDKISIILKAKKPSEYKFQDPNDSEKWFEEFILLKDKVITKDQLREIIRVNKINNNDIKYKGSNTTASIYNGDIFNRYGLKILYSLNSGKFRKNLPDELKNNDRLIVRFIAEGNKLILFDGKYIDLLDQKFVVSNLDINLIEPKLEKELFFFETNKELKIKADVEWKYIFFDNKTRQNTKIYIYILRENSKDWETIYFDEKSGINTEEFINSDLFSTVDFRINDRIRVTVKANEGYVFDTGDDEVSLELSTSNISKFRKIISVPNNLSFDEKRNISKHAVISKESIDVAVWDKLGIKYEFKVIKNDGIVIYYGNTNRSIGKVPVNLGNGYKIFLTIKNNHDDVDKSILQDINSENLISQTINRHYTISSLDTYVSIGKNENMPNITTKGFEGTADLVITSENLPISYKFAIKRSGESEYSDFIYNIPSGLSNGDVIIVRIYANSGYAFANDKFERIEYFQPQKIVIKDLKKLIKYNLPESILIIYDKEKDKYFLSNIDVSSDEIEFLINDKVVTDLEISKEMLDKLENLVIEVRVKSQKFIFNGNKTKLIKTYIMPSIIKPYLMEFDISNLLLLNDAGKFIINKGILSNLPVDFKIKFSSDTEYHSLNYFGEISNEENLIIKIIPKKPAGVLILDSNQNLTSLLSPNIKKIKKVNIIIPDNINFEGWNNNGSIAITKEIELLNEVGVNIRYIIKRNNKEIIRYSAPSDLRNGDHVKIIAKGNSKFYIENGVNNEMQGKFNLVSGLARKPQNKNLSIIISIITSILGVSLISLISFYKIRKGVINGK